MINSLTSLRLIFAMMVFGAHCYVIDDFFSAHFFKEGFVGVSFFFVLSGFVIAYNYQHKLEENKTDRKTFWVARFARVYPLHWLTLFAAAVLGNYVVASGGMDWLAHFLTSLTLTHAYIPKADYSCYYWLPVAMVIISFALQKGIFSRLLNNCLMVTGGEISYSFYLIHLFILLSYAEWQKTAALRIEWYYSVPVLFVVIILLSLLSYRYFEKPMNRKIKLLLNK